MYAMYVCVNTVHAVILAITLIIMDNLDSYGIAGLRVMGGSLSGNSFEVTLNALV